DHHRHAERRDADDGGLPRDQLEIACAEEARADERAEQQRDHDEPEQNAAVLRQPPRGYDAARAPDASITSACSVHADAGPAGPSRPRDITAMQSPTPKSSGR